MTPIVVGDSTKDLLKAILLVLGGVTGEGLLFPLEKLLAIELDSGGCATELKPSTHGKEAMGPCKSSLKETGGPEILEVLLKDVGSSIDGSGKTVD